MLLPEFRHEGLRSRAAQLLVRDLRERLGWRRITVDPATDNHRAIDALEKRIASAPTLSTRSS